MGDIDHDLDQIRQLLTPRDPIDAMYQIELAKPLVIDYKERRHLFIFSANSLTLTVEDFGTLSVSANTFTNIGGFPQGTRLTPTQTSPTPVFVRATDETVP